MYSNAVVIALLATAFSAPIALSSPFGLIASSPDSKGEQIEGFTVFTRDDGTLWLGNPSESPIQVLGTVDLNGDMHLNSEENSIVFDNENKAAKIGPKEDGALELNQELRLSNGEHTVLSTCPTEAGYQVFAGEVECADKIEITLKAVDTDGSDLAAELGDNMRVTQNFCCPAGNCCHKCHGCPAKNTCICPKHAACNICGIKGCIGCPCDWCHAKPCVCPKDILCHACSAKPCVCPKDVLCHACSAKPCVCPKDVLCHACSAKPCICPSKLLPCKKSHHEDCNHEHCQQCGEHWKRCICPCNSCGCAPCKCPKPKCPVCCIKPCVCPKDVLCNICAHKPCKCSAHENNCNECGHHYKRCVCHKKKHHTKKTSCGCPEPACEHVPVPCKPEPAPETCPPEHVPEPCVPENVPEPCLPEPVPEPCPPEPTPEPCFPEPVPEPCVPEHIPEPCAPEHVPEPCVPEPAHKPCPPEHSCATCKPKKHHKKCPEKKHCKGCHKCT